MWSFPTDWCWRLVYVVDNLAEWNEVFGTQWGLTCIRCWLSASVFDPGTCILIPCGSVPFISSPCRDFHSLILSCSKSIKLRTPILKKLSASKIIGLPHWLKFVDEVYMAKISRIICPRSIAFFGMIWVLSTQGTPKKAVDSVSFWPWHS